MKTKALTSGTGTEQLICAFVFAYVKSWFSQWKMPFWAFFFICEQISKIFAAHFRTFEMQKDEMIIFVSGWVRTW